MEVKPGYKQTEIGVIPEDWTLSLIRDLASIFVGRDLIEERYSDFKDDIFKYPVFSNTVSGCGLYGFYKTPEYDGSSLTIVGRGAGLGTAFRRSGGYGAIGRLLVLFPRKNVDAGFLTEYINNRLRFYFESGGIPQLTGTSVSKYRVPAPPTKIEQEAIAEALNNADAPIESFEQLIVKKRHLKQGAMQRLLTGKERLPDFEGEWEIKRLGDTAILKARIGWQGLTTAEYLDSGDYYLVTGTEFRDGYVDWDKCHFVNESRYKQDKYIQLKKSDVLVTKDGTIGKVALVAEIPKPATLNSGVFVIRPIEGAFHPEFFYYLLCSNIFNEFLIQLSAGSTINHLYQKDFVSFIYRTPATIEEQAAIAAILSDMDVEIAGLEAKLAKARHIRQGMTQELLTGRTRLI
jgi:type I restriction enzyme, S subunit